MPDIKVALQGINGRLTTFGFPIGLIRLISKTTAENGEANCDGRAPEFRQHGVAEMLVLRIIEEAMLKLGFKGELSMTLENNVMINRFLEAIGAVRYKTYRIYSRGLEGEKPAA